MSLDEATVRSRIAAVGAEPWPVTLSKNGSQVNVMPSHETGLLSCIRQERGLKSHAKVMNC